MSNWESDAALAGASRTVTDISDIWDAITELEDEQVSSGDLEYTYDMFMSFYRRKGGTR